jgi:hypothetical protein
LTLPASPGALYSARCRKVRRSPPALPQRKSTLLLPAQGLLALLLFLSPFLRRQLLGPQTLFRLPPQLLFVPSPASVPLGSRAIRLSTSYAERRGK